MANVAKVMAADLRRIYSRQYDCSICGEDCVGQTPITAHQDCVAKLGVRVEIAELGRDQALAKAAHYKEISAYYQEMWRMAVDKIEKLEHPENE